MDRILTNGRGRQHTRLQGGPTQIKTKFPVFSTFPVLFLASKICFVLLPLHRDILLICSELRSQIQQSLLQKKIIPLLGDVFPMLKVNSLCKTYFNIFCGKLCVFRVWKIEHLIPSFPCVVATLKKYQRQLLSLLGRLLWSTLLWPVYQKWVPKFAGLASVLPPPPPPGNQK